MADLAPPGLKYDTANVLLLKGDINFDEWKRALKTRMSLYEYWGFTDGTYVAPAATATPEQKKNYR